MVCTVEGGGHTWPGGTPVGFLGKTTKDLSATDMMWSFFQKHPLDGGNAADTRASASGNDAGSSAQRPGK
jgi:hypothetical protein